MKRINHIAARVLATALVAGVVAAAIGGVSMARAGSGDRTFTVTEVQTGATFVDVSHSPNGAPGDQAIFRSAVRSHGERIGTSSVVCEIVLGGKFQCTGIYRLPGGTITGTAMLPVGEANTATVHIAITGGTGRFDHVSGQAVLKPQSSSVNRTVFDLD